ncbi:MULTISPECIES: ATP-dependent DNA helicase [Pseudomonas]|uniref:ATP-dependent DNA helicase n=1 Tax=Pseudomonas TaxID=286 RepID=UPI00105E4E80|nr:ATP-dependent DNA helicase [Pseudomonas oryzihabitans]
MSYRIAVRALCEFTAKAGDLDLRFTPSPTALEGIEGHQRVAARRGPGYECEVSLQGDFEDLQVRGRADGFDAAANRLEEIKTHRGSLERQPGNHRHLHLAQAKVYGHLLCQSRALAELTLALVYFDIGTGAETVFTEQWTAADLAAHFELQCSRFLAWARQELAHRAARDTALATLAFPHPDFRHGQRPLAEAVYKAASVGCCLLAQAPTGIGKTVGTLFPLLKAMPRQNLDRLFFLAAKTPGRALALHGLDTLDAPVRVLELVARDKACEHPELACHGESCPLARGFYDRLPAARAAALAEPTQLTRARVRETALAHQVCPYYLAQELARWSDVVVGDYNYYFDGSAMLHALAQTQEWRVGVLVDEAHNLLDRARGMYSASLDQRRLASGKAVAPPAIAKGLQTLNREWNRLHKEQQVDYQVQAELPAAFLTALQRVVGLLTEHFGESGQPPAPELQTLFFDLLQFMRLGETFGDHSLFDVTLLKGRGKAQSQLNLRNLVPAPFVGPRLAAAHSCTLFSATLIPQHFHRDLLGVPAGSAWVDVASPFAAEQLEVRLVRLSTRYADRAASRAPIAALIASRYRQRPGNYLAFFSSFDYLDQVAEALAELAPDVPQWRQSRGMDEAARQAFLERFQADGRGIGFAVLGGSFGEGIDLPGDRLIGAFVATLGLPQLNPVNEQLRQRLQWRFGDGYRYAYLYPGLQKVIQAAGRVIRTVQDRGCLYLIDDRFTQPEVRALLPTWWQVEEGAVPTGEPAPA